MGPPQQGATKVATKVLNLSDEDLTEGETRILLLGLSFCPTPKSDVYEAEKDIYHFSRKLRLKYHFANLESTIIPDRVAESDSLIKIPSNFTPKKRVHAELENLLEPVESMNVTNRRRIKDNIAGDREDLRTLIQKTKDSSIVIKPADKGDIVVIQNGKDYYDMCMAHLTDKRYYKQLGYADPTKKVELKVIEFAKKYKQMLTTKEYEFLTSKDHKMSNFYMLPKLHKNDELNEVLKSSESPSEYLQIKLNTKIEGRPIISGPAYHTSGISKMLHLILQPCLEKVKHVLKDTFDFVERFDKEADEDTQIITWDIKSLYPNISHKLFFEAISYWVDRFGDEIPLLSRFSKNFVLDGLYIILKFNYAYYDKNYYHQIKGTATGTNFAVVGANLVVGYKEVHLFVLLPEIYPQDFVDWFIRNYFRFLDDVCHKWKGQFDLEQFAKALNEMDADLQFIMDAIRKKSHYLDVFMEIVNREVIFDVYHKPTNSFGYLKYSSCHPPHTINNIALSLAKRIVRIVSHNSEQRIEEMKNHLMQRDHPEDVINTALSRLYAPSQRDGTKEKIVYISTFNPHHSVNRDLVRNCVKRTRHHKIRQVFGDTDIIMAYKQPDNLRKILTRAKFERVPRVVFRKPPGLYPCRSCTFCERGYIKHSTEFTLDNGDSQHTWVYTRHFSCNSKNVLYVARVFSVRDFYVGRTKCVKTRVSKHISDVHIPKNSTCKDFIYHVIKKSNMIEPYFEFLPFFYEDNDDLRDFMEKRFIKRFKPQLNGTNV